ncbi:MAG: 16S rRNA (adenine(1518)-N(6)/adenine(1519)-N(6))-dimethyltransferase RsmA [Candidatus Eremiobacteraeota bacterium]|nr:16S rRNA (adenine(1518)-N(6)/adenine(1519)-N(6))-dimethyltransferase RsmA [Candidatus Eremiobacteraeota bacterium]
MPDEADAWRVSPKQLLDERNLRPRKRFGQNFLTDPAVADRIARDLPASAGVIEIGGGTGTLTAALARTAQRLIVVEIDRDLTALLQERFAPRGDAIRILSADALSLDYAAELEALPRPRAVVGNLPYYITTPLLERILETACLWDRAVLMVQREYARRLLAAPGSADYSSLTVFASYFSTLAKVFDVGASGFYPAPKVASTVVALTPHRRPEADPVVERLFLALVRASFAHRRKTLVNSLLDEIPGESGERRKTVEAALAEAQLHPLVRAERLSLEDFLRLSAGLARLGFESAVFRRG